MTISKYQKQQPPEEDYSGSEGSDYSDSDSDMDPSYGILENTQCQLSNLSINKKSKSRIGKDLEIERDPEDEDLVLKIIESGKLEKLKVEQCKVYLRKNGLRLTGNKDTLICRIKEHQEILNGGGEKKYPVCSFVLNCKGDACMGDVVMFEQKVYEMYNIASRSASGPPCGKRIVAGRIVNESYGAAKQQHTFTIEVLWSKGEKPLPPLHPLLIKGRNLYRLETMRQRWEDEEERRKVLMEKHTRGSVARDARETRVQEKERKKILRENRNLNKEKRNKNQLYSSSAAKQGIQTQESGSSVTKAALESRQPSLSVASGKMTVQRNESGEAQKPTTLPPLARPLANGVNMDDRPLQPAVMPQKTGSSIDILKMGTRPQPLAAQHQHQQSCLFKPTNQYSQGSGFPVETRKATFQHDQPKKQRENDNYYGVHQNLVDHSGQYNFSPTSSSFSTKDHYPPISKYSRTTWENGCLEGYRHSHRPSTSTNSYDGHHKYPLTSRNSYHSVSPLIIQGYQQQQPCKFYAQGRCKFGDNCKFLHDSR